MIPYFVFLFFLFFFYHHNNYKGIMITLILFSVLRYDVGWDYMSYYEIALNPEMDNDFSRFSFFWQKIYLFAYNHHWPSFAIAFPSLLICLFAFWGIYMLLDGNRKKICDALVVYSLWPFFYLGTFSTIRQGLAISICLVIYAFLRKRKIMMALCLFVINFFIHPSSLVSLVLFPVLYLNYELKLKSVIIVTTIGIIVLFSLSSLAPLFELYFHYVGGENGYGGSLAYLLILIIIWLLFSMFIAKKKNYSIPFIGIIIASFGMEALIYLFGFASIMSRMLSYFSILFIFVFLESVRVVNPKLKNLSIFLFLSLFLWYLIHSQQGEAMSGYVPYKFIFL